MTTRKLLLGAFAATLVASGQAEANDQIKLSVSRNASDHAIAEIHVDGDSDTGPYKKVVSDELRYIVSVSGAWNYEGSGQPTFSLWMEPYGGEGIKGDLTHHPVKYQIKHFFRYPRSQDAVNVLVSPVDLCNARLQQKHGQARADFLESGVSFLHENAYDIGGNAFPPPNNAFVPNGFRYEEIKVPVRIVCKPLDRPRASKDTSTTGAPSQHGQSIHTTITKATLRIEPAKVVQDGKFLCPSQLKLYGHLETRRKFSGNALFVGPHHLSVTPVVLQTKGNRNFTDTYEMDWHKMGGFTTAPNAEPKKQKLTFHFNVATKDGELLKSAEETVEVSCKKIKVAVPTVGDEMTVKPAN
jgi:hypothetical protein